MKRDLLSMIDMAMFVSTVEGRFDNDHSSDRNLENDLEVIRCLRVKTTWRSSGVTARVLVFSARQA